MRVIRECTDEWLIADGMLQIHDVSNVAPKWQSLVSTHPQILVNLDCSFSQLLTHVFLKAFFSFS